MKLGNKIEVVLQIDDLQVISFDKFIFKPSQQIDYDEGVRIHINFLIHSLNKRRLLLSMLEENKNQSPMQITKALLTAKGFIEE